MQVLAEDAISRSLPLTLPPCLPRSLAVSPRMTNLCRLHRAHLAARPRAHAAHLTSQATSHIKSTAAHSPQTQSDADQGQSTSEILCLLSLSTVTHHLALPCSTRVFPLPQYHRNRATLGAIARLNPLQSTHCPRMGRVAERWLSSSSKQLCLSGASPCLVHPPPWHGLSLQENLPPAPDWRRLSERDLKSASGGDRKNTVRRRRVRSAAGTRPDAGPRPGMEGEDCILQAETTGEWNLGVSGKREPSSGSGADSLGHCPLLMCSVFFYMRANNRQQPPIEGRERSCFCLAGRRGRSGIILAFKSVDIVP